MKYLITDKNIITDFTYQNVLYFNTTVERDNYVQTLFTSPLSYMQQIENDVISDSINQDGTGKIVIKPNISKQELYNKNYIIIRECDNDEPLFYFITNIRPLDNRPGEYSLEVIKDVIMSNPGFMNRVNQLELTEGHVIEPTMLDLTYDAGYKTNVKIKPLDRTTDAQVLDRKAIDNQWLYVFISQPGPGTSVPNVQSSKFFTYGNQLMPYRVLVAPLEQIQMKSGSKTVLSNDSFAMRTDNLGTLTNIQTMDLYQPIDSTKDIKLVWNGSVDVNDNTEDKGTFIETSNQTLTIPASIVISAENTWTDILFSGGSPSGKADGAYKVGIQFKWDGSKIYFRAQSNNTTDQMYIEYDYSYGLGGGYAVGDYGSTYVNAEGSIDGAIVYPTDGAGGIASYTPEIPFFDIRRGAIDNSDPDNWIFIASSPYSAAFVKLEVEQAYQGLPEGDADEFWTSDELIDLVNGEITSETQAYGILGAKISSFNPLKFGVQEPNKINLDNVSIVDRTIDTTLGWQNGKVIELMSLTPEDAALLNTYSLDAYKDKSWANGINNYSLMIENNKEFNIDPEQVLLSESFQHQVVPTPNEWTERLVFGRKMHDQGLEFSNNKEFIFGTNVLADYQLNNPTALDNATYNNNTNLLKTVLGSSTAILSGISSGGLNLLTGGGLVSGVNGLISNAQSRKTLQNNIAGMNEQPPISTGNGSAYQDYYFNKYGFRLCIATWAYTTTQAESTIMSIIKNGIKLSSEMVVDFDFIKRPNFNYIKVINGLEVLSSINDISNAEKAYLANVLESGIRLWYNPTNFLNYEVDNNNQYFNKNMINYISQSLNRA